MKKPLRYRIEYLCARAVLFSVDLLPELLSYRLAGALGRLFFRLSKRRRRLALRVLRNAYPGQDDRTLLDLGRRATGDMFKMPLDIVRVTRAIQRGRFSEIVDMSEAKSLPPPPFMAITGHVGSWETGAVAMAHLTHEAHAIVRTFRNPLLTRFVFENRRLAGLHLHPQRGGIRGLAAALRRGCVVLQAADQRQRNRGVWVPFFGELASTARSGVALALRQGCPIVVGRCERVGVGFRFRVVFSEPFHPVATGDHAEDVRRAAAEVNRRLEEHILARPDQYVWIHDRYRQSQEGIPGPKTTKAVMSRKKKVAFFCILWALVFALAEASMRIVSWINDSDMSVADESLANEWTWARAHLREGRAILSTGTVYDPLTGWRTAPNLNGPDEQTNSQGMRNHREFSPQRDPERNRLVFVGDSYTYGFGVRNEDAFATLLASEFLPEWDVLNMAVSGMGTDQQLVTYREYGRKYRPDIVILGFFVRDYHRNLLSFRDYLKPFYGDEEGEWRLHTSHLMPPEQLYEEYESGARTFGTWYDSHVVNALARVIAKARYRSLGSSAEGWRVLEYILEQFHESVIEAGSIPIWMIIPYRDVFEQSESDYKIVEDLVEAKCEELGMLCLRLDGILLRSQAADDEAIYRPRSQGGHFSVHGNRVVARAIYEFLKEKGLPE